LFGIWSPEISVVEFGAGFGFCSFVGAIPKGTTVIGLSAMTALVSNKAVFAAASLSNETTASLASLPCDVNLRFVIVPQKEKKLARVCSFAEGEMFVTKT
jgi:hypothetical protein